MAHIDDERTQRANLDYIRSSMSEPMLEREHEQDLARRWQEKGDEKALHEMVVSYTRLVISAAVRFKAYGLPMGDLIQEGNIGLMQAANRFDPSRDVRFSTYASWWIKSSMQDYVLRNWSIVRTGTTAAQKSLFFNLRRLRAQIKDVSGEHGLTSDGRKKISTLLGVTEKDVEHMEGRMSGADQSLNATIGESGEDEYMSFLADERPNPEEVVIGMKDSQTRTKWLAEALGELSVREQQIIKERHLQYETVTLEDLGKQLGVSKERVRQLEARAMEKLKTSLSQRITNVQDVLTARA